MDTNIDRQPEAGETAGSPYLAVDGYAGPLDHLLALARGRQIDIAAIALSDLLDQLVAALRQASARIPLGQKADWVVTAAWLVQLRTRLLLPADEPAQQAAETETDQLRARLVTLETIQALALWLSQRPQLGNQVFARGRPEVFGMSVDPGPAIDMIEFLWASLDLFDDTPPHEAATFYRPETVPLHTMAQAQTRILQRLGREPGGALLTQLLPEDDDPNGPHRTLRRRSAWAATFVGSLELVRQGAVEIAQPDTFAPIRLRLRDPAARD
jgi:segregation and condensation protein A